MSHHVRERVREILGLSVTAVLLTGCAAEDGGKDVGNDGSMVTVQGLVHAGDGMPLAGVEVCERRSLDGDPDSCTTSVVGGAFTLAGVPANELVSLTFRKDGFVPMLRSVLTGAQDVRLPESENALLDATRPPTFLGVASDPSRGQVEFHVESAGEGAPDVVATLTEVDGSPVPPAPNGGAQTTSITAAGDIGGFLNVPPGTYVLRIGGASSTCAAKPLSGVPVTSYQPPGVAALVISVLAGYVTAPLVVSCATAQP
jgi:hypothetical protein